MARGSVGRMGWSENLRVYSKDNERQVETDQDDEVEVRACPTVTPPAAHIDGDAGA